MVKSKRAQIPLLQFNFEFLVYDKKAVNWKKIDANLFIFGSLLGGEGQKDSKDKLWKSLGMGGAWYEKAFLCLRLDFVIMTSCHIQATYQVCKTKENTEK